MHKPVVSAIICTYNRANLLEGALQSLFQQTLPPADYEVIVVDNNSTDHTRAIVKKFSEHFNLRYVFETKQGLGHARNRGCLEAEAPYVAFMDDDAKADREWLEGILSCFSGIVPAPQIVGGPMYPYYATPKPVWFKDEYEIRTWGNVPRFLKKNETFSGCNMAFNKKIIEQFGAFNTNVGMKGQDLSVGEETLLFRRIWTEKGDSEIFYYSPSIFVFHMVPTSKMSVWYKLKRSFAAGETWYIHNNPKSLVIRCRIMIKSILNIFKASASAIQQIRKYSNPQNWVYERLAPIAVDFGRIASCVGFQTGIKQRS